MKPENMVDVGQYYSVERLLNLNGTVSKKKILKSKRRFSDEQIQSLEVMFESETKLEPGKKAKLAKELGLQPRQVAIWFQNKRARWKSKIIEKDYGLLLADYNNLASQFEDLKKEKQSLLIQLQKLQNETETESERKCQSQIQETAPGNSCTDGESDYNKIDLKVKNNIPSKTLEGMVSDDYNSSIKQGDLLGLEEDSTEFLKLMEPAAADSSLTSPEDWGSLDSDDITHQADTESCDQWWDFWC